MGNIFNFFKGRGLKQQGIGTQGDSRKGESAIIIIFLIIIHNMYNKVQCQNNWYNFNNLIILYYTYYE